VRLTEPGVVTAYDDGTPEEAIAERWRRHHLAL
jgi:hypothetical protein